MRINLQSDRKIGLTVRQWRNLGLGLLALLAVLLLIGGGSPSVGVAALTSNYDGGNPSVELAQEKNRTSRLNRQLERITVNRDGLRSDLANEKTGRAVAETRLADSTCVLADLRDTLVLREAQLAAALDHIFALERGNVTATLNGDRISVPAVGNSAYFKRIVDDKEQTEFRYSGHSFIQQLDKKAAAKNGTGAKVVVKN